MDDDFIENDNLKEKNLNALKHFIKTDLDIKNKLMELAPSPTDDFDESSRIAYIDRVYESLKDFEYKFQSSLKGFQMGNDIDKSIEIFFENLKENLTIGSFDRGICKNIYQSLFSDMSKNLIENVKENFVGYTDFGEEKLSDLICESSTINELLHVCHSYIMNNDIILSSITKLEEKKNKFGYPITLYGEKSELSEELFKEFPLDLDVGWTDIVSIQDQILMMVRDRGHALTLTIDNSQDKPFVKYFIPKICNEDMIRALPGVDEKALSKNGVLGSFECDKNELLSNLFGFIGKVPTDNDIPSRNSSLDIEPVEYDIQDVDTNEQYFSTDDIKEFTKKEGKNGRLLGNINKLLAEIKVFFKGTKEKNKDEVNNNDER